MSSENLNIILFSLPVYQLLYFTIQLIIARKYTHGRLFAGFLILMVSAMAVINAFAFYGGQSQLFYSILFSLFFLISLPTLRLLLKAFGHQDGTSRPFKLVKDYAASLVYGLAVLALLANFQISSQSSTPADMAQSNTTTLHLAHPMVRITAILFALVIITELIRLSPIIIRLLTQKKTLSSGTSPLQDQQNIQHEVALLFTVSILILPLYHFLVDSQSQFTIMAYNILLLVGGGRLGQRATKLFEQSPMVISKEIPADLNPQPITEKLQARAEVKKENQNESVTFISPEEAEELAERLKLLMEDKKPYTNPKFSLDELCEMLNTTKRKAGYVLSHELQNNFYGLINEYRVEESIRILESDERKKYTIDSIAQMSGFQSKSSFYTAFKKLKNITPGEYKVPDDSPV